MLIADSYWPAEFYDWGDVIETFSPFDRTTMADLDPEARGRATRACFLRVASLLSYHGPGVPRAFVDELRTTSLHDVGRLMAAYLDNGAKHGPRNNCELQQELLHFSRITDVEAIWQVTSRRLRNSRRLSGEIRTAIEFATVVRSRCASWGIRPPPFQRGAIIETTADDVGLNLILPSYGMVLTVQSARQRHLKEFAYVYSQTLAYLSPEEAVWLLASVFAQREDCADLEVRLGECNETLVSWRHPGAVATRGLVDWLSAALPQAREVRPRRLKVPDHTQVGDLSDEALRLLDRVSSLTFLSLECGHVHLDRELDDDQRVGLLIARSICDNLQARGASQPEIVPLIDDEHVLVRTLPSEFNTFFETHFGQAPSRLVPESSPLLMAIGLDLLKRLEFHHPQLIRNRGVNRYIRLADETVIELVDHAGEHTSLGCVVFECALLMYRSDPRGFDAIGRMRLDGKDIHKGVLAALEGSVSPPELDKQRNNLLNDFDFVQDVSRLVSQLVCKPRVHHLNVLEAYYAGQQRKVRKLLNLLNLPVKLFTLEFDRHTGSVHLTC